MGHDLGFFGRFAQNGQKISGQSHGLCARFPGLSRHTETGSPAKRKSSKEFNSFPGGRARHDNLIRDHGALHDKPDDKLKLIKYQLPTRNQGGQKRDINVTLPSAGAGVVQV
jgi:hypothetical protein